MERWGKVEVAFLLSIWRNWTHDVGDAGVHLRVTSLQNGFQNKEEEEGGTKTKDK